MSREEKKLLFDIQQSIEKIEIFMQNCQGFENYDTDIMLQSAVERNLEIIGEATNKLLRINTAILITNARKIVDTRNRLIHGYDSVDNTEIWAILINHLPVLKKEVSSLLNA